MPPRIRVRQKKHAEERTIKNKRKQKKKEVDVIFMDSSTNHDDQSESWECLGSARKHFIPDSTMISYRRASLRSDKRITQTGITSASRHSLPRESREHSLDVFQQACQVSAGSLVKSPSEYHRQVAYPSTMTPERIRDEIENVGTSAGLRSFTADVPEMKEVREADKSRPNHSNQMEELYMFEAECNPLEQEHLAKQIQTSNNIEDRTNKNCSQSIFVVEHSSPCFSLSLTEMINMWDDEDDEVNSVGQSLPIDPLHGYQVKPESILILRKILSKHGDIAKNSIVLTLKYRSMLLEMICGIISKLQEKNFSKIKEDDLHNMIALVNDIKNMKVDIEWLHLRLVDILEARQTLKLSGVLKEKKESSKRILENVERELEECEAEKKKVEAKLQSIYDKEAVCKETLARARDESTKITAIIADAKFKVKRFLNCSLADGLL